MCCWLTEAPASCLTGTHSFKEHRNPFLLSERNTETHACSIEHVSEGRIKQYCTRESSFHTFMKPNLLFPLSLRFPATHNYSRYAHFAHPAVQSNGLARSLAAGGGKMSTTIPPASISYLWDQQAAVVAPCLVWVDAVIVCSCSSWLFTHRGPN